MSALVRIGATEVRQDAEGRFSLNDLHRASGSEGTHQPSNFLRLETTQALIREINSSDLRSIAVATRIGRNGGTYVCRELVYAYAMWVSPAFHLKVIRTFDAVAMGRAQPAPSEAGLLRQLAAGYQRAAELAEENARLKEQLARGGRVLTTGPETSPPRPRREMPWLSTLRSWLAGYPGDEVTTDVVLAAALNLLEPTNVQRGAVGRCMKALGWTRGRRRHPGGLHWVYVRPIPEASP